MESVARRKNSVSQDKKQDESCISLTEIARAHSEDAPGYVIQSWLRSGNTLAFLNLWEQENNPDYSETGYEELLEKKKAASFTLTPKLWIDRTKAIGIVSKQGKAGGTFAHPMIACEFVSYTYLAQIKSTFSYYPGASKLFGGQPQIAKYNYTLYRGFEEFIND